MCALLLNVEPGDEIIIPSFTFVSTANAFVLRGAKIVFADSSEENPNIDASLLESLITSKTKAIVVVHYAGISCEMREIMELAEKYNLFVVEDAAQAIDSYFEDRPLGSIGHLATFSFHETKNIQCGEGGMLVINDENLNNRAEIIREKGTNRSAFFRGEIDKYSWVDIGSSFLPSEITAAFLYAQLEKLKEIQQRRKEIWINYHESFKNLEQLGKIQLPKIPVYASNNAHMFYLNCRSMHERAKLILHLKSKQILSVFHYLPLHNSSYYSNKHDGRLLEKCDYYSDVLLRLPLYFELSPEEQSLIIDAVSDFYSS